jgi:hypothetical protein
MIKALRLIHLYIGVFIAPAVLFFAFTGILQTLSLHESSRESSYKPPAWIVELAQLHKKQTLQLPVRKAQPVTSAQQSGPNPSAGGATPPQPAVKQASNTLPMKVFFVVVGVGLILSTITGLYMSCRHTRRRVLLAAVLLSGIVIPVLLTLV